MKSIEGLFRCDNTIKLTEINDRKIVLEVNGVQHTLDIVCDNGSGNGASCVHAGMLTPEQAPLIWRAECNHDILFFTNTWDDADADGAIGSLLFYKRDNTLAAELRAVAFGLGIQPQKGFGIRVYLQSEELGLNETICEW